MSVIDERPVSDRPEVAAALASAGALFGSLGRTLLCLDAAYIIRYSSTPLARAGQPIADVLGDELFGPLGTLRQLLEKGESREGWRAAVRGADGATRLMSLAAAPCNADGVSYVVVLRPAEEDAFLGSNAPTFFFGAVARSQAMLDAVALIDTIRTSDAPVLLIGEEGTGKKTLARALHASSSRRSGRFVPLDCAGFPGELLAAEIFGHVRTTPIGTVRDRAGCLELAQGGTLYLDHVTSIPLLLQTKLLHVVQERAFERAGEDVPRPTDARIVAACTTELRRAVESGAFREDLARQLRTIPIEVPPLRARPEDIEPLAQHLLARVAARHGRELRLSPDAVRALLRHTWPGNVRELETAIEHAAVVAKGQTIHADDLPADVTQSFDDLRRFADSGEVQTIRAALDAHHWNRESTARALGMSRTTLWRKMRELRLV
jgi:DNA-binding NtrC family response regulator